MKKFISHHLQIRKACSIIMLKLLLPVLMLLTACSENDPNPEIVLLKKITLTQPNSVATYTYEYDENNKITSWTEDWNGWVITYTYTYSPNQVTITSSEDDVIIHTYNTKNQLIGGTIQWAGSPEYQLTVEYAGGTVSKQIIETDYGTQTLEYTYDANNENIVNVKTISSDEESNATYEFEEGLNPFYKTIEANSFNVSITHDFYLEYFLSKNLRKDVRTFTLNERKLPVSAVAKNTDGEVTATFTYEYEIR